MKITTNKILAALVAGGLMAVAGSSIADSTFGYNSTGTGGVSAKANVKVTVTVPELVVLRVGSAGATIDELKLQAAATINGAPGLITTNGNNQAATWDDLTTPTLASDSKSVQVYVWTNAKNVKLKCSSDTGLASLNLLPKDIKVDSPTTHPGATTECTGSVDVPRNQVVNSTWTYSVDSTALGSAYAGTASQVTTYTAANI
mgnify:CR=1 FL=1